MNPEFWVHCVKTADGWWAIEVPDANVYTQSRTLAEVENMARDATALMLDIQPDSFDMDVVVDVPLATLTGLDELLLFSRLATDTGVRIRLDEAIAALGFSRSELEDENRADEHRGKDWDKSWGALTDRLCARLERVERKARNIRRHATDPNPFRGSWRRPLWWFDAFCHSLGVHVRPLCDYLDRRLYR